jgi:hypothetical protein
MDDSDWGCDCEDDIRHYLHNLDFFAGVADKMKNIALTKSEVLALFNKWMEFMTLEEKAMESTVSNPFIDMIRGFMQEAAEGVDINLSDLSDPNFSFTMDTDDLDEEGDDDESLHRP